MNENEMRRLSFLDEIFRGPHLYNINELLEKYKEQYAKEGYSVGRRQLLKDIDTLEYSESYDAPIERKKVLRSIDKWEEEGNDKRKKSVDRWVTCFTYTDKQYSIRKLNMNSLEESQLKQTLLMLSRFRGMPQFGWLGEITTRLVSGFNLEKAATKIIEIEQNTDLKNADLIAELFSTILNKQVLLIEYQKFHKDSVISMIIHPYFLKRFNNRWFLFGLNVSEKEGVPQNRIFNVPIDRILTFSISDQLYIENKEKDFEKRFSDIIGVTYDESKEVEKIILKVSSYRYPYIETKPLHKSQDVIESNSELGHTIISIDVQINKELETLLLSYGADMEVLEPKLLREEMKSRVGAMCENYNK